MSFRLTFHSTQNSCSSSIASARVSGSHRPKSFPAHRSKTDLYSTVLNQCSFSNRRKFRCQPVKLAPPAGTAQGYDTRAKTPSLDLTQAPSSCTLVTNEVGPLVVAQTTFDNHSPQLSSNLSFELEERCSRANSCH